MVDGAAGAVDDVEEDEDEGDSAEEDATTQTDSAKPQSVNEAIAAFGWEVHRGGKHIKLSRKLELADGSEVYQRGPTLSCTPSDNRARKNQLADLIRKQRETFDQMKMLENEPSERGAGSMASRWDPDLRF